jgi:Methyladenine glycosylase
VTMSAGTPHRCGWAEGDPLLRAYDDEEWGAPEYDSRALWEKLMLDGFQAGLSASLRNRKGYWRGARSDDASRRPAGWSTPAWNAQFRRAAELSYRQLQLLAGAAGYGV